MSTYRQHCSVCQTRLTPLQKPRKDGTRAVVDKCNNCRYSTLSEEEFAKACSLAVFPTCTKCGSFPCQPRYQIRRLNAQGIPDHHPKCTGCMNGTVNKGIRSRAPGGKYRSYRNKVFARTDSPKCVMCGFVPVDLCQIDIDHIDGNHDNHDMDNLQVLCANCHRLKSKVAKDCRFSKRKRKEK